MPSEENLLVLKMLQDGTISADQAAELLQHLSASEARSAAPAPAAPPAIPAPPAPAAFPDGGADPDADGEPEDDAFSRARARIAAARERVSGFQEKLVAAEERLEAAKDSPQHWTEALRDLPAAKSVAEAFRGIDPGRIAANARRQARRLARGVRSSVGDLNIDIRLPEPHMGEPTFSAAREVTTLVSPGGTLRIKNPLGDIEAQGADVPEARIAGVLKVWAADAATAQAIADQVQLIVEQGPDGPSVSVRHPERVRRISLDLKAFVPARNARLSLISLSGDVTAQGFSGASAVVLGTQSGDIRVSEVVGEVAVETQSGDVALEGITGNAVASSASGDIAAIRAIGQSFRATTQSGDVTLSESSSAVVAIETVSGDAAVRNVTGRTLRIRAVSGDATADACSFDNEVHLDTVSGYLAAAPRNPMKQGTFTLVTVSGDGAVRFPPETAGTLEATSKSGEVNLRFLSPDKVEKVVRVSGMVRVNEALGAGGSARISLSTISGDLKVTQDSTVVEIS